RPLSPLSSLECTDIRTDVRLGSAWWLPRLEAACRNLKTASAREFGERVVHNLGRALFVFLPLMAALMKLLYWRPRRYYLEHLLLLIHNHSFAFLVMAIYLLATHWISSRSVLDVLLVITAWYVLRYLYRSMKNFYGQSRWLTSVKFVALGCAY